MKQTNKQQFLLIIFGEAGSGKSTLFHLIKEGLEFFRNFVIKSLATTGTAAYIVAGDTLHWLFKIYGDIMKNNIDCMTMQGIQIAMTDLFMIDEFSMCKDVTLNTVD